MKLIKFSSTWCGPCKIMNGLLQHHKIYDKFEHVDVDENAELVAQYKIRGVPTIILADDDGNVVRSISGNATADQLIALVKEAEQ